uniref:Transmembrane protein n=1 Tax=Mimivirus LCMiAC01 TaxID=2506608 RepID=A0A481Z0E6_9VIRU|nr:MAG: hypothetical protein LCMiAC01_04120 [Mimivirus LCMiAC01]
MIILILCAIVSTVLASSCWLNYASLLATAGETIPIVTIDTNYSKVFIACGKATGGIYELKYEINNTDTTDVRIYYEELLSIDGVYTKKIEMCTGSCISGNAYVCCKDFDHKLVRVTVENLRNGSQVVMNSLNIHYGQIWVTELIAIPTIIIIIVIISVIICILGSVSCLLCCVYLKKTKKKKTPDDDIYMSDLDL